MIAYIVGLGLTIQIACGGFITMPPGDLGGFEESIIQEINESIKNSVRDIQANIKSYSFMMQNMTDTVVEENMALISERIQNFKKELAQAKASVVVDCLIEEGQLDVLEEQVNEEVKSCTKKVMTEVVNVISDSLNQAQTFMSVPEIIGKDIQKCGFSPTCMQIIVMDAISESLQIPPKVMTIAAKIQQLNLRTVTSIDTCMLNSIKKVTKMGFDIIEDVLYCIEDTVDNGGEEYDEDNEDAEANIE
ncbi:unnamed protein product [Brassicogethes aeneus]|uniref:Secreted protein n=1 Tax=Brassicogethes aeneus TaxID=1431903 RepID=A0A9P0B2R9_BRAAE|nr:unnamed protein product [Brassicogethes aeneus]